MKYLIETYGCQLNKAESDALEILLKGRGIEKTENPDEADAVILNTCSVRKTAENRIWGRLGFYSAEKRKHGTRIIVTGCMAERLKEDLKKDAPYVDAVIGTNDKASIPDFIVSGSIPSLDHYSFQRSYYQEGAYSSYVPIMNGCNNFCSYCIVPYTRGRERSRLAKDILDECQELIDSGYQEITLLGQNVNAYGKDLKKGGLTFAQLLEEVAKLGIPRLRFTTSHPWDFSKDIIEVIAKYPNIMKSIHLPVQSGNDEILKSMGRRYNSTQYKKLVDEMKKMIPNLTLSTDIIVGFPNETYEQFLDTLKMVDYVQYDSAFTFIYSPRQGTPAAKKNDDVSLQEKHRRFNELVKTCEKYISASSSKMVGHVYDVLVDGPSKNNPNILSGYTESNKIVHFAGDQSLIGKIVKIKIIESHTYSLIGELYNE